MVYGIYREGRGEVMYCAKYDPHPTPLVYAIHHTILAVTITCKRQA